MPIRRLLSLFGNNDDPSEENPFAAALRPHLKSVSAERLDYLTGFAGQLTRVAYADDEVSEAEAAVISKLLVEHGGLREDETRVVIDLLTLKLEELRGCDDYRLNRAVGAHATMEEKEQLVDLLFAVASADDQVSNVEDQEIRLIGNALDIPIERFMDIRTRYRDKLEVLRAAAAARAGLPPRSKD